MRYSHALLAISFMLVLVSCKKQSVTPAPPPGTSASKHVLLKDITIPNLPSPYYHFEYGADSSVTKADFASGFTMYDVLYSGSKISEMRNNTFSNHDTLRYIYDNTGKVGVIKFINGANIVYRHVFLAYNGDQIKEIEWDHKEGNVGFLIDRTLTFTFYPDGNVKTIAEHRPAITGSPESNMVTTFEQYDDKISVDDFGLIHDDMHDHLFLGVHLQKNNPKKETLLVDGANFYTVDYTYTYNTDNTPSAKIGELLYTGGPNAGQRFQTHSFYTYY